MDRGQSIAGTRITHETPKSYGEVKRETLNVKRERRTVSGGGRSEVHCPSMEAMRGKQWEGKKKAALLRTAFCTRGRGRTGTGLKPTGF
jgi:hypothetical protein